MELKFNKELYAKAALMKAAYNYIDKAYVHLDVDDTYYYVSIEPKIATFTVSEEEFINEMLIQSVRHEIYGQTKNIRELLMARALATSVIVEDETILSEPNTEEYSENEILKDWFDND